MLGCINSVVAFEMFDFSFQGFNFNLISQNSLEYIQLFTSHNKNKTTSTSMLNPIYFCYNTHNYLPWLAYLVICSTAVGGFALIYVCPTTICLNAT